MRWFFLSIAVLVTCSLPGAVDFGETGTFRIHDAGKRRQEFKPSGERGRFFWNGGAAGYGELFLNNALPLSGYDGLFTLGIGAVSSRDSIRSVNLRLCDRNGETFQWKAALRKGGDETLCFDVTAENFSDCWGGDGKIDPPVSLVGTSLDFIPGHGEEFIELGKLEFTPGEHVLHPVRERWRNFDSDENWWDITAYRGSVETASDSAGLTLKADAGSLLLRDRVIRVERFGNPREMMFRIRLDAGEAAFAPEFHISGRSRAVTVPMQTLKPGENLLRFVVPRELAAVPGVSIECLKIALPKRKAVLVMQAADVIYEQSDADAAAFGVSTPRPVPVVAAGEDERFAFRFANPFPDRPLALSAALKVTGFNGDRHGCRYELRLAPGECREIPFSLRGFPFGHYRVQAVVSDVSHPELAVEKEAAFVYMRPAGPTPGRAPGFLFGVCSHPERWNYSDMEREAEFAGLCGVKVLRSDTEWNLLQPSPESWRFRCFDFIVDLFGKQGIELDAILAYLPAWMREARARKTGPDDGAWREFVSTLAKRYKGRIRFWEVWNEPDLPGFAPFGSGEYVRMLKSAYEEVKKVDPEAIVMNGGFATGIVLPQMLADPDRQARILAEGKGFHDLHAFHGHGDFPYYAMLVDDNLLPLRKKIGVSVPWYANETALTSTDGGERKQAETLFKKLVYSWSRGAVGFNWYDLRNDGFEPMNGEHNYGMLTFDFQPKPVYAVYNTLALQLTRAEYVREIDAGEGLWLLVFRDGNDFLLAAWNEAAYRGSRFLSFRTGAEEVAKIDLMGNFLPQPVDGGLLTAEIGTEPALWRFRGADFTYAGEILALAGGPQAMPGRDYPLTAALFNPFGREMTFRLKPQFSGRFRAPGGIPGSVTLPPGGRKTLNFNAAVSAGTERSATLLLEAAPEHGGVAVRARLDVAFAVAIRNAAEKAPDFTLDRNEQVVNFFRNDPHMAHLTWRGPKDLSAEVRLGATDGALVVTAKVVDDNHVQPFQGGDVWKGDNIQIGLSFPGQRGFWELGTSVLENGKSEAFVWRTPYEFAASKVRPRLVAVNSRTGSIVSYRLEIPFDAVGITRRTLTSGFRFNLVVNDNDGGGREGFIRITPGLAENKMPNLFPYVMFME